MKNLILFFTFALSVLLMTSCAGVKFEQVEKYNNLECICIQKNQKVIVGDFLQCLIESLGERNIRAKVFQPTPTSNITEYDINGKPLPDKSIPRIQDECNYYITYTANLNWDMAMYMTHAEISLYNKNDKKIGYGEYSEGMGLDLRKYKSTKDKVRMILDEMFSSYPLTSIALAQREKERLAKKINGNDNQ